MITTSISERLKLLISLSLLVTVVFAIVIGYYLFGQLHQAEKLQRQSLAIQKTAAIIHNLQKERGLSSGFVGSRGAVFGSEVLNQRVNTSHALSHAGVVEHSYNSYNKTFHTKLTALRHKVDALSTPAIDAFDTYTDLISGMRSDYLGQVITVSHFQMRNQLQAYTNLMAMKEAMGQMRGAMAAVTSRHAIDHQLYLRIAHAKAEFDIAEGRFLVMANPKEQEHYAMIKTYAEFALMFQTIDAFLAHPNPQELSEPHAWFVMATEAIDNVYGIENGYFIRFNTIVEEELSTARMGLIYGIVIFALMIASILLLGEKLRGVSKKISHFWMNTKMPSTEAALSPKRRSTVSSPTSTNRFATFQDTRRRS
ncbi:MAG: nitrate- and nitrite sensing domain-containing protein [Sulfuricurvum sp.]|nr:nitrate- and nitrite sensing domain-containing protein [Sulfuricurvum sp.]